MLDEAHHDLEILWGWKHSDHPDNHRHDLAGTFGEDVSLSSDSKERVQDDGARAVVTVSNPSYRFVVTIDRNGKDRNPNVRYILNPGETYFTMLSVASDKKVRFKSITTEKVECELGGMPSS